jgi:hypothetical protein
MIHARQHSGSGAPGVPIASDDVKEAKHEEHNRRQRQRVPCNPADQQVLVRAKVQAQCRPRFVVAIGLTHSRRAATVPC